MYLLTELETGPVGKTFGPRPWCTGRHCSEVCEPMMMTESQIFSVQPDLTKSLIT